MIVSTNLQQEDVASIERVSSVYGTDFSRRFRDTRKERDDVLIVWMPLKMNHGNVDCTNRLP